jgi:hypothetical protein
MRNEQKLFIFNHRLTNEQQAVEAQSIVEDQELLWQGKDWDTFNKETGLTQSQIGGLELKNGKLVFNQELYNNYLDSKKPLAMGKDLIKFLNDFNSGMNAEDIKIGSNLYIT